MNVTQLLPWTCDTIPNIYNHAAGLVALAFLQGEDDSQLQKLTGHEMPVKWPSANLRPLGHMGQSNVSPTLA